MSAARHMIALLKSHLEGDDKEFLSVAMQAAAHEARLGHIAIAQQLRDLIDESKRRSSAVAKRPGQLVVLEPRGELASLLSVQTPSHPLQRHGSARGSGRAAEARASRTAAAEAAARTQPEPAPQTSFSRASRLGENDDGLGARGRTASAAVHDHARRSDHEVHGRDGGETAPRLRSHPPDLRAFISSTNSTRSARTAASRTMWARSAAF